MSLPSPTTVFHHEPYAAIDPRRPELSTAGKNVVVTGGGKGIGAHIAYSFAQAGAANLAIVGRTATSLDETRALIARDFPSTKVHVLIADITDLSSIERAFEAFVDGSGKIDILVANAGYLHKPLPLDLADPDDWWSAFTINVRGNFNTLRALRDRAAADAVVLNVSTGATHVTDLPGHGGYSASKLAATRVFDYFAQEHPGLRVVQFHPGIIETDMAKRSGDSIANFPRDDSELLLYKPSFLGSGNAESVCA